MEFFLTGVAVFSCLLVLAGFLVRQGLHGWPKNSRPLCRRCGYLLEGLTQPRVCPECGADLTRRRAVRLGENRRRRRVLFCGLVALGLAFVAGRFTWSLGENAGGHWERIKPVWLLRREARAAQAALPTNAAAAWGANPALRELNRRMERGDLSDGQIFAVVEDAMAIQEDTQMVWDGQWGDIVERAAHRGLLGDEQIGRYVRQAHADFPQFTVAARAHEGSTLNMALVLGPVRASQFDRITTGSPLAPTFRIELRDEGGRVIVPAHTGALQPGQYSGEIELPISLVPGTYALTIDCAVSMHWVVPSQEGDVPATRQGEPLVSWSRSQSITLEVIDRSRPLIDRRADEAHRAPLTNAIVLHSTPAWTQLPGPMYGNSLMAIAPTPVAISFDVFAREATSRREELIGFISGPAKTTVYCEMQRWPSEAFPDAAAVDLVLRTNPEHASRWRIITEVWDGEIVVPSVPIPSRRPMSQPGWSPPNGE